MSGHDFSETFPLHERTYKYYERNFELRGDTVSTIPEGYTRIDCDRCDFFEHVTTKAMTTYTTMILPLYIRTLNSEDHYILCPSCRLKAKGKIKEWVKSGKF